MSESHAVFDQGTGDSDIQSVLFELDFEIRAARDEGLDYVLEGCALTGGADMTPDVAAGVVVSNGAPFAVTAGTVTIGTADATNPRIDLIVVNSSGTKAVRAGTAAANPTPPARTANDVVLGYVYVPAADTSIETTKIIPKQCRAKWDLCVALASDATANSTTTGAEITNLSVPLAAGTYRFSYYIIYQSGATTTGVQFGVNYTGTVTRIVGEMKYSGTGTTASTGAASMVASGSTGQVRESFGFRAVSTTAPNMGATVSVDAANTDMLVLIEGTLTVSDRGDLELWHASEVAASSQVMAGSSVRVTKVG